MKIIDERGRLFGKINIVDFLIIALVLVIIPIFYNIYRILGETPEVIPNIWIKVEAFTMVLPAFTERINEGDVSYDEYGNPDSKITKILHKDERIKNGLKEAIAVNTNDTHYRDKTVVFFEMELLCTKSAEGEPFYFRRCPVLVGLNNNITFTTSKYSVTCYISKFIDGEGRD